MGVYLIMKYFHWEGDNRPMAAFSTLEKAEAGKRELEIDCDWNEDEDYHFEIMYLMVDPEL